jgi:hypothetical protein
MGFGKGLLFWLIGIPLPIYLVGDIHAPLNPSERRLPFW